MKYSVYVAISSKTNKPYGYIDLGYTRIMLSVQQVADICRKPVYELVEINEKTKVCDLQVA